jgi:hypothetical protein
MMEYWNVGILEWWNIGIMGKAKPKGVVIPAKAGIQDSRQKSGTILNTGYRFSPVRRLFMKPSR